MSRVASVLLLTLILFVVGFVAGPIYAQGCDATVAAPGSIQDAIDGSEKNGTVCLDDSGGLFGQQVLLDSGDSGISLVPEPGDSPIMDGTPLAGISVDAITMLEGVKNVTIDGLEIRDYKGDGSNRRRPGSFFRGARGIGLLLRDFELPGNMGILILLRLYAFLTVGIEPCAFLSTIPEPDFRSCLSGLILNRRVRCALRLNDTKLEILPRCLRVDLNFRSLFRHRLSLLTAPAEILPSPPQP